jgi:phenylalanyl-tRNA synthetase alpha subunit
MDNYEVNVLTRKGGWKKLPQEVIQKKDELKLNNSDNLNINVTEDNFDSKNLEDFNSNLFENFTEISSIIDKLKTVENQKNELIDELNELMKNFEIRKNNLDKKLTNIQKEKEMYDKAINLIISLKNV